MIKLIKMVNGEEILADYDTDGNKHTLENPVRIINTGQGVGFMPWVVGSMDKTYVIGDEHVMFVCEAAKELEDAHIQQFGGIVMPKLVTS